MGWREDEMKCNGVVNSKLMRVCDEVWNYECNVVENGYIEILMWRVSFMNGWVCWYCMLNEERWGMKVMYGYIYIEEIFDIKYCVMERDLGLTQSQRN